MALLKLTLVTLAVCGAFAQQDFATNYNTGDSGRSEKVLPDGTVEGQYSYTDPNGKLLTVKYRAGKDGFQVEGDHLPKAPVPQAPAPQQPQNNNYNQQPQQQYNQQPQQQYNQQPQQQYNQQPQQQYNQQPQQQNSQLPASTFFSNNGQSNGFPGFGQQQSQGFNNYQHPNSLQQPQPSSFFNNGPQQQYNGNTNNNGARSAKVSVSSQPGQGFSYTYES